MRFGLVHRVMTDALAALGVLAVVSTASLSPWTNASCCVGLAAALAVPEAWQSRPALRHFATIAPLALLARAGRAAARRAVPARRRGRVRRARSRSSASRRAGGPRTTSRSSSSRCCTSSRAPCSAAASTYGLCFLGFLVVAPGRARPEPPPARGRGQLPPGRARPHRPARRRAAHPAKPARRRARTSSAPRACSRSPSSLFTAALFVLFPRVGLSLLLLNHPHAGRMIGFSEHVDLGDVGVLRDDPTIALRFEVTDLADPPPTRLTLRLRGTAFDAYDGRAWARTAERAHARRARPSTSSDTYPDLPRPRPRARPRHLVRPRAHRPARDLPAAAHRRACSCEATEPDPARRAARRSSAGRRTSSATPAPTRAGLRYDVYLARRARGRSSSRSRAADRARYLAMPPELPGAHRGRSRSSGPTACRPPDAKARAHRGAPPRTSTLRPELALGGQAAAARRLPLRVEARALRVLLDRDGDHAARPRHPVAQRHGVRGRDLQPLRPLLRGARGGRALVGRGLHRRSDASGLDDVRPDAPGGAQPLERTTGVYVLPARLRRGAVAAVEHVRRRLRPAQAGAASSTR